MITAAGCRARLYGALADALAEVPPLGRDGEAARSLIEAAADAAARGSPAAARAAAELAGGEPPGAGGLHRRLRLAVHGARNRRIPLHEGLFFGESLGGPTAQAVAEVYSAAGLQVDGAEGPDHASVELAFLEWLAIREAEAADGGALGTDDAATWRRVGRRFLAQHPGRWLPDVGLALAGSGDAFYSPAGRLLAAWIAEETAPLGGPRGKREACGLATARLRPDAVDAAACSLCGHCVQVCGFGALEVRESEAATRLTLKPNLCTGCGACADVCQGGCLRLVDGPRPAEGPCALVVSPRASCPTCGTATVSRAELTAVAAQLGSRPEWLEQCPHCRRASTEVVP